MPSSTLRPWGPIAWLLPRTGATDWSVFGTVSVEERCLATVRTLGSCRGRIRFVAIGDPDPLDRAAFRAALEAKAKDFNQLGVPSDAIAEVPLMASLDRIKVELKEFLDISSNNIILDISSMPKRWFFPTLKLLLYNPRVANIVVSYAIPQSYGGTLSENPDPIRMLPGFSGDGRTEYDSVIIGIGFDPLGVTNLFTDLSLKRIRLLFPFPPGPPGFNRNLTFVKQIEEMTEEFIDPPDRADVNSYDCSQVFDALCDMTSSGSNTSVLAPYGPKPMSLAMCLFSLSASARGKVNVPVYYAQPRRYASDYSTGIRVVNGTPEIHAYCVKINGNILYQMH